ncbi:serine hydrolase domain-containing protein [Nonomuraea sp. NPDC050328]|uniref:serine hydrolase domain-containing protein n=1 Tax=Nonomuraea sp. NPDC050328 TaxID=3364361 RepID=UPI00379CB28A
MDTTALRARLAGLLAEYRIPGASVGLLRDGEVTDFALGVADVTTGEPVTTGTAFQIGSLTKTWTAVTFLRFVEEGKAALDEPVRAFLPGFKVADLEVSAKVTPRHLLNHTHGIEEDFGDPGEDDDVYERMVAGIAGAPQVHPLGHTHGYSAALGYAILARVMEVIDGRPWDDILTDRLVRPLGLSRTSSRQELADPARMATGHLVRSPDEGPIVSPLSHLPRLFGPSGTMTSTPREVLALARLLLDEGVAADGTRILSPGLVREMTGSRVPLPEPYSLGREWALGLLADTWSGVEVYGHDGSTIGHNARLRILPELGLAVAMTVNGGPRDGFYRRAMSEILTSVGAPAVPDLPAPDPTLRLDPGRYTGRYERPGLRYDVGSRDGTLTLSFHLNPMEAEFLGRPDRIDYDLLPVSETHFVTRSPDPLEDPQVVALYDFQDGKARYLHTNSRVTPRAAPAAGW